MFGGQGTQCIDGSRSVHDAAIFSTIIAMSDRLVRSLNAAGIFDRARDPTYDRRVKLPISVALSFAIGSITLAQTGPVMVSPTPRATAVDPAESWSDACSSRDTSRRFEGSRGSATAARGPTEIALRSTGLRPQLKSYGCTNTARLRFDYSSSAPRLPSGPAIARTPDAASGVTCPPVSVPREA